MFDAYLRRVRFAGLWIGIGSVALATRLWLAPPLAAQSPKPVECDIKSIRNFIEHHQFPGFIGCTVDQAEKVMRSADQNLEPQVTSRPRNDVPEGIIFTQYPEAGVPNAYVEDGVRFTVSSGPPEAPSPSATYTISDAPSAVEGGELIFTVSRTGPTDQSAAVTYETAQPAGNGDAVLEEDFQPLKGTVTVEPGKQAAIISIKTVERAGANGPRHVRVILTGAPENGQIVDREGVGDIVDKADPPTVSIDDTTIERDHPLAFTIRRSGPISEPLTLAFTVEQDGFASEVIDPLPRVTIPAGKAEAPFPITYEQCATTVTVTLSDPQPAAVLSDPRATATILGQWDPICEDVPPTPWWIYVLCAVGAGILLTLGVKAIRLVKEWLGPARVSCALDPHEGSLSLSYPPSLSPPRGMVRVTIADGELHILNQPVVSPKEVPNG